ncbi:MAG: YlmC/YmxH family sporulation protein [Ruminococcaceae bacterium]|nr:YlmC/YmxH family sporulation protein [Oscillospiraceae bacterium]
MICSSELREREVVNICTGKRLGYVCDIQIDTDCGKICAVFVSDSFFCFSDRKNTVKIEWNCIKCIGEDIILVEVGKDICDCCDNKDNRKDDKKRRGFFF